MDKKNTLIGALLLVAAFGMLIYGSKTTPRSPSAPEIGNRSMGSATSQGNQATGPAISDLPERASTSATFAPIVSDDSTGSSLVLNNEFIEVRFTELGGAIKDVALKKYPAVKGQPEPFIFNQLHADPILAFTQDSFPGLDRSVRYQVISQKPDEVVFRAVFENRIEVTRRYYLESSRAPADKSDPYRIRHETTFRNLSQQSAPLPRLSLSLGTTAPTDPTDYGRYLVIGYYDGNSFNTIDRSSLQGGGLLSFVGVGSREPKPYIEANGPLVWASVNSRFFTSLLTPDQPAVGALGRRVELPPFPGSAAPVIGITGSARFQMAPLPPDGSETLSCSLYVGPKEYKRLANADVFKHDEDKTMQFGFFKFFSQILLTMMTAVHGWLGGGKWAWGFAILITTLMLKTVFLPLTLSASKSAKRMQKIQPQMQAMREKYKDNPQKLNQATIQIFKEHKVNPMGGCLPILITIPFFMGFFQMLQATADLRFAEFLWAGDLSAPDTVARIFGLPLNIMPILMGATTVIQMRLTPQPTVDNAQAKMMKFMPYMFALICYNFSCALSLYSTVNGVFTIVQQLIINRMKDPVGDAAAVTVSPSGKPMKNVTGDKKKKIR